MMTFKRLIIALALVLGLGALAYPQTGAALFDNATSQACEGVALGDTSKKCIDGASKITDLIHTIVNVLSIVGGIAAVVMIIVGGIKYTTSGGDSGKVSSAKNTIIFAVIGLVVVALAQIIVRYVINTSTK